MNFIDELREKTNEVLLIKKQKEVEEQNKKLASLKEKYKNYFDNNIKQVLMLEANNGNSNASIFLEQFIEDGLIEKFDDLNDELFIEMLNEQGFRADICDEYEDYDESNPYVYISWKEK